MDALRTDHDIRILARAAAPDDEEYALRSYEHEGIRVDTINNTFRRAEHFFFLYAVPEVDRAMARVLDEFAPDLVHVHHLTCLSTGLLAGLRRRGIPSVMTLHDFWMICPRGQRIHPDSSHCEVIDRERCHGCIRRTWSFLFPGGEPSALVRKAELEMLHAWDDHVQQALAAVDRLIVPSRFYRDAFVARGLDPDRLVVVAHGLDPTPFAAVAGARRPAEPKAQQRIGYLGTVLPSKGVHVLLEAVRGLGDRITVDIHGEAVPYHEDAGYLARLRAAVPDGIEVRFHGRYEPHETPAILASLDVLVVPSIWYEAFGLTVREGFLAGLPVVAADLGGLAEAIAGGRGLGFRPGDAADLRRQLLRLLDEPELADRVRGRPEWVRTPAEMVRDTLAVYEAARAPKPTPAGRPDPLLAGFRAQVAAAGEMDRTALLERAARGLERLAGELGLEPGPARVLRSLARSASKARQDYALQAREVDWLRSERAALIEQKRRLEQQLADQERDRRRRVAWLEETRDSLESARRYLEESLARQAEEYGKLRELHDRVAAHAEALAGRALDLEAHLKRLEAALAEREALLARLAGSAVVRVAARLRKIPELRTFRR
ncbi:MAG: glycosyltransferase [Planctomycetes bacterium]|nr:glycosyltransferase [Planctomycetota bacterium]